MATSRRVPMHRPRSSGGGAKGRPVSRPGTSEQNGTGFISPFQPPPAGPDLLADVSGMDPNAWQMIHAADRFWRMRTPGPSALAALRVIAEQKGGEQVSAMNRFISDHMHPEDMEWMLGKMADPDDPFGSDEYQAVYRAVVTVGTARPFSLSSLSPTPPPIAGVLSEPSWLSAVYRGRSRR